MCMVYSIAMYTNTINVIHADGSYKLYYLKVDEQK